MYNPQKSFSLSYMFLVVWIFYGFDSNNDLSVPPRSSDSTFNLPGLVLDFPIYIPFFSLILFVPF